MVSAGSLVRVRCTLPDGKVEWIDQDLLDYDAPFDLPPQEVSGSRAVDSPLVAHTGDRLPTSYVYTLTGNLHATSPQKLELRYFQIKSLLRYADQVWRGERFLNLSFAVIGGTEPLRGQCVVPAAIACAVSELRWYDKDGVPLE